MREMPGPKGANAVDRNGPRRLTAYIENSIVALDGETRAVDGSLP